MKKLRFLSIVLVLSMLFSFSAYAISPEEASQAVSADLTPADTQVQGLTNENIDNVTLGVGELTLEQLGLLSVEDTELHEKIDIDTANQKGHVNRLYEQENDLHTMNANSNNKCRVENASHMSLITSFSWLDEVFE